MRFTVERNPARDTYDIYALEDRDGKRFAHHFKDGQPWVSEVTPGSEVPLYIRLDVDAAQAVTKAVLGKDPVLLRNELDRADDATKDAREVRDRLLTIVEGP